MKRYAGAGKRASGARVRGDTDFTQTQHLDRWDAQGVEFVFGIDAMKNLKELASGVDSRFWKRLRRPSKRVRKGEVRARAPRVKESVTTAW